jgi:hypothetical protein
MASIHSHIDLAADVQAFKDRMIACTTWNKTTGGLTFYTMYGNHYIRSKSSLTRKKVLHNKEFARTRHNAALLSKAAETASSIYQTLTEDWRCQDVYRKLVSIAGKLLHAGVPDDEVLNGVVLALYQLGYRKVWPQWEGLPPMLEQWMEKEKLILPSRRSKKQVVSNLIVNKEGQLLFTIGPPVLPHPLECECVESG